MRSEVSCRRFLAVLLALLASAAGAAGAAADPPASPLPAPTSADFEIASFSFGSGESLPRLRLHYATLGTAHRDAQGRIDNAVLLLHGTGGSGAQFLVPQFAGELFGPGQPLDVREYFIIMPDNLGHGGSSKPSDGLHARFPHYDYDDMVRAQHELLLRGLGIDHLRLILGTSMGCMHAWVWGETYPGFAAALMPLACLPVPIAGRNRIWRDLILTAISTDPDWRGGEYTVQPVRALRTAAGLLMLAGSAPLPWQMSYPTREAADRFMEETLARSMARLDANDLLYQVASSRNYDPSRKLQDIHVPVAWVNSADDFINPPELGIAEREAKRLPRGHFTLLPASLATHGHGTHTWAVMWKDELVSLLGESHR
ncbi:MAG: alpha/beta fold hydrolase [Steroidobacteraceae bacterium]